MSSEWQTDEQIAEMLEDAEEAGEVEAGRITVDAMDLVRVLSEVAAKRERDDGLAVRLMNWADSEDGAKAVWSAWKASMDDQFRPVDRHRSKWDILEPTEQTLDRMIAARVVRAALEATRDGR